MSVHEKQTEAWDAILVRQYHKLLPVSVIAIAVLLLIAAH